MCIFFSTPLFNVLRESSVEISEICFRLRCLASGFKKRDSRKESFGDVSTKDSAILRTAHNETAGSKKASPICILAAGLLVAP